jgi:vitamin B12 transporter
LILRKPEIFVFVLCLLFCFNAVAQNDKDSVRQLKTVIVQQSRLNDYVIASYELPLDSSVLALSSNGSLTDLLRKQGFGHIRTYGPGGLASPSFRGTGSSHTAVLWNGLNLVSPLSGQLDLSLVSAGLFDDATIQTGGSTSLSGNGSIGANIHLNNNINFNEGLRVTGSSFIGSFGSQYYDAGAKFSNKTFGMSTKVFFNSSDNDFTFINRSASPDETQKREHSAFDQHGLLQQLHWSSQSAGIFSLKFWYQRSFYEIPNPTGIPRPSEATEDNEFYRALAGWNFSKGILDFNYQAAFIRQDLDYADPIIDQHSLNRYNSTIQNFETNFNFANHAQLTSGIHYTWEEGVVDDFGDSSPVRNRIALFSAYKFDSSEKWKLAISGRGEFVNGKAMPFSPTISVKYNASEKLKVFTNLSRNYRIPTFNDLYWQGAGAQGNPDLKTEVSLSAEAGVALTNEVISFKSVGFTNHVDNWILWSPTSGQVWTPQNIKKVWSRGAESQLSLSKKIGVFKAKVMGQYSYTRSTNVDIYDNGNPNEKGKQLLLTPRHEGSATIEGEWKHFVLRVVNSYTGEQFNDSDNTPYNIVYDYLITNIWLSKVVRQKSIVLTLTGEINNAFDVEYVGRPGYPMPGINYKAGIKINFNKTNKL